MRLAPVCSAIRMACVKARRSQCGCAVQIIVFCVTAMLTKFYAELFQSLGSPVLEIHSRKSQSARTKAADAFRTGSKVRHCNVSTVRLLVLCKQKPVYVASPVC